MTNTVTTLMQWAPSLFSGIGITLSLVLCSLLLGLILAWLITIALLTQTNIVLLPLRIFTFIIRGSPLLVQFFLIYYGVGQLTYIKNSLLWPILAQPFACALMTLSLNTAAYSSEIFLAAAKSVPKGEIEAAAALGMLKRQWLWHILIPKAMRRACRAYANEAVILVKSSALASTITLLDIMGVIQQAINETYLITQFYVLAALLYGLINAVLLYTFNKLQQRMVY